MSSNHALDLMAQCRHLVTCMLPHADTHQIFQSPSILSHMVLFAGHDILKLCGTAGRPV